MQNVVRLVDEQPCFAPVALAQVGVVANQTTVRVTVTLLVNGRRRTHEEEDGRSTVQGVIQAIEYLVPSGAEIVYRTSDQGDLKENWGRCHVELVKNGARYEGSFSHANIFIATAKAHLEALNKLRKAEFELDQVEGENTGGEHGLSG